MTSERSKRRNLLALSFITKSISVELSYELRVLTKRDSILA